MQQHERIGNWCIKASFFIKSTCLEFHRVADIIFF